MGWGIRLRLINQCHELGGQNCCCCGDGAAHAESEPTDGASVSSAAQADTQISAASAPRETQDLRAADAVAIRDPRAADLRAHQARPCPAHRDAAAVMDAHAPARAEEKAALHARTHAAAASLRTRTRSRPPPREHTPPCVAVTERAA